MEFKDSDEDEEEDEEVKVAESSSTTKTSKNKVEISKSLKTILLSKSEKATVKSTITNVETSTPKMSKDEATKGSSRRHKNLSGRTKKHVANRSRRRQTLSTTTSDEEDSDTTRPKPGTLKQKW